MTKPTVIAATMAITKATFKPSHNTLGGNHHGVNCKPMEEPSAMVTWIIALP